MTFDEIVSQTVEVYLACSNPDCASSTREDSDYVCRFFDLRCGDCNELIRAADPLEA